MRVDWELFDGDTLLERGSIQVGVETMTDIFSHFQTTGQESADIVLTDFSSRLGLKRATLDMPIHESEDWESAGLDKYTFVFWCRLDA